MAWIDRMCAEGKAVAVGECGLDAYYCTDPAELAEQERVLRLLIEGVCLRFCFLFLWVGFGGKGDLGLLVGFYVVWVLFFDGSIIPSQITELPP